MSDGRIDLPMDRDCRVVSNNMIPALVFHGKERIKLRRTAFLLFCLSSNSHPFSRDVIGRLTSWIKAVLLVGKVDSDLPHP